MFDKDASLRVFVEARCFRDSMRRAPDEDVGDSGSAWVGCGQGRRAWQPRSVETPRFCLLKQFCVVNKHLQPLMEGPKVIAVKEMAGKIHTGNDY